MNSVSKENLVTEDEWPKRPRDFWPARYNFVLMTTLGYALSFTNRVDMSVAIVAMVNRTNSLNESDSETSVEQCPGRPATEEDHEGEFGWDEKQQGLILGAFSIGYVTTQFVGGYISDRFGGKWIFGGCVLTSCILGSLVPTAAKVHPTLLVFVRVLQGVFQGPTFPCVYSMATKWLPAQEKTRMMSIFISGGPIGIVVGTPMAGILVKEVSWESVFYIEAGMGLVWFAFFAFLCFNSPADHPRISKKERTYIESNVLAKKAKVPPAPILRMVTSRVYWVLQITHFAHAWGFLTLIAVVPTYLNNMHHLPIEENGLLSAAPYLTNGLMLFPFASVSDRMLTSGKFSKTFLRKLFNSIALCGPALALIWISFEKCNSARVIVALCIGLGLNATVAAGVFAVFPDVAPNYSGTLMGISNTFANSAGFISPIIVGLLTEGNQTWARWRIAFLLAAGLYFVCATVFVIFGTTKVQSWDKIVDKE